MKYTLLFFALHCCCNILFSQYSDVKEYGLKGNVKSIHNEIYLDIKAPTKKGRLAPEDKPTFSKIFHFTSSGQMDTMRIEDIEEDSTFNSIYVFDFENGVKSGCNHYGLNGEPIEFIQLAWLNKQTYTVTATDTKGELRYENISWLNTQFQDSAGRSIIYNNGEVIENLKYINRLDKSKRVVEVNYYDEFDKLTKSEAIEYKEFDKQGNWTLCVVSDTFTGKILKMTVRTIAYY